MLVYRLTDKKHSRDLSGTGASMYGGRWNKRGTPVLYTSESEAVALLEIIVHTPPMLVPDPDLLILEIPDDSITAIDINNLPTNWADYPAPSILVEIGVDWVYEGKTLALKIPSCIIHSHYNYVINCQHPDFISVKTVEHKSFRFDPRLKKHWG
jgi:RES domain-containing protein